MLASKLDAELPDEVLLDVRLPGMDGLAAMDQLRKRMGQVPIIVMTAYGDLNTAVQAVRNGAFDYLAKPFDLPRLRHALGRALSPAAGKPERSIPAVEGFIATTAIMQEVFNSLALASASNACILLHGESGTGKELAARTIHKFSRRRRLGPHSGTTSHDATKEDRTISLGAVNRMPSRILATPCSRLRGRRGQFVRGCGNRRSRGEKAAMAHGVDDYVNLFQSLI